jgi:hypothetical protein
VRSASSKKGGFNALLDCLVSETSGDSVTLKQLLDIVSRRSFGAVMLLLGLIAVSPLTIIPGASWGVAAVTLVFALQSVFGARHPWLPKKVKELSFKREALKTVVEKSRFAAHIADRMTKPRLTFFTEPPFVFITSLAIVLASAITFPLALIPLGPVLPGVSIVMFGIGLTARDGLFLGGALMALGGAIYAIWSQVS